MENGRELRYLFPEKPAIASRISENFRFHWKLKQPLRFDWKRGFIRGFSERLLNACEWTRNLAMPALGGRLDSGSLSYYEYNMVAQDRLFSEFAVLWCSFNFSLSLTFS